MGFCLTSSVKGRELQSVGKTVKCKTVNIKYAKGEQNSDLILPLIAQMGTDRVL
jgi:hypothetical protein